MANKNLESLAGSLFLVSILPFIAWVMNINKDDPKPAESPKFSETQAAIKSEPLIKPNTAECPFKSNEYCYVYINGSGMVSLDEAISDCEKRGASLPKRKDVEANRKELGKKLGNSGAVTDVGYLWAIDENDEYASPESISDYYPTSEAQSIMDGITLGRKEIGYACVKLLKYRTFPSRPNKAAE